MNRSTQRRDLSGGAALALYLALAVLFFGRSRGVYFGASQLGLTNDPSFLMWALKWWPQAIGHGLNPFICRLVWAPEGFNLAWSGGMPLVAMIAAPLTSVAGPIATYNTLAMAAPAIAAWCGFLMCRGLIGGYWPALVGGYVFGFSSYMLGQLAGGHLNLLWVFPAPLMVMAIGRALEGSLRPAWFAAILAACLVAQFLCSIELAATAVIFGGLALILHWLVADAAGRNALRRLVKPLILASVISLIVLSPYLYYVFNRAPAGSINSPGGYSADLLNLIVPTATLELGRPPTFQGVASHFPGNLWERDAYLGLPLLLVIIQYGWARWDAGATRVLIGSIAIVLLCAFGPRLRVSGWSGPPMPWKLAMHIPVIKSALPSRFTNYAFLAASLIVARWLSDQTRKQIYRVTAAAVLMLSLLPNLDAASWIAAPSLPAFFAQGVAQQVLGRDETIVAIPYGIRGYTMLWQAAADLSFRMAGGYTGRTPREFERWPIVNALMTATLIPDASLQLEAFMAVHQATAVVVDDAHREPWTAMLEAIDPAPRHIGGIWLYRTDFARLAPYQNVSPVVMEERNAEARFAGLLEAAHEYLDAGYARTALTPARAQALHLLPPNWVVDRDVRTNNGLYLGPWTDDQIAVGVVGSYDALKPVIAKYRVHAARVFFPFPKELVGEPQGDRFMRLLVMVYDRDALTAMPSVRVPARAIH